MGLKRSLALHDSLPQAQAHTHNTYSSYTYSHAHTQVATVLMGLKRSLALNDSLPGARNRHAGTELNGMRGYASAGVLRLCVCS